MRIRDLFPLKGTFSPGESAQILAEVESEGGFQGALELNFWHFTGQIDTLSKPVSVSDGLQTIHIEWQPPPQSTVGYVIEAYLLSNSGHKLDKFTSAVDILPDWTANPRYGFLCDFFPEREDIEATIQSLLPFHINGLQFYDWQYRHDRLLAPENEYTDPLGRRLSLGTIRAFLEAAHDHGIAAMPYLAVYAASLDFWREHSDWALYDKQGEALTFMNFLGLMDPTPQSPWQEHLLEECARVAASLPFDGFHVDQYGDPKKAYNVRGGEVNLPNSFVDWISALKERHPEAAVVFNAVGNWPIEVLATAPQDFLYIEIWPPDTNYLDLVQIVSQARQLSLDKPIVIALYLPAERPANVLLADALITSCGGSRIEIGETVSLLADPYFPKYQSISVELKSTLRRYADFSVAYGELLGPAGGVSKEVTINLPPGIWAISRSCPGWLAISLVNLPEGESPGWDIDHGKPQTVENLIVELSVSLPVRSVWWASPDRGDLQLNPARFQQNRVEITATLPYLDIWGVLFLELDENEAI